MRSSTISSRLCQLSTRSELRPCPEDGGMYGATHLISTLIVSTSFIISKPMERRRLEINQALSSYNAPKITSLHLGLPEYVPKPQIHTWIELALSRNVEKLYLNIVGVTTHHIYENIFYLGSSLTHLYIKHFSMPPRCTVSWKSLRKLTLADCVFYDESIDNILSGSPLLETLALRYCRGPRRLDFSKSPSLRRLEIFVVDHMRRLEINHLLWWQEPTEIVAPHIHYLSLNFAPCVLVDVSSLAQASIDICRCSYRPLNPSLLRTTFRKMLAKLRNVKRLTFTGTVLQILSLAELHGVPFPTFKVQILTLNTRFTRSVIPGLASLLQNSPELKKLIAHATLFAGIEDRDLDSYLDSQGLNKEHCWRSKHEVFPTAIEFGRMVHSKDAMWKLIGSFTEMVMRNVKTLETLVVGLKTIEAAKVSDARWFEYLLQMLPTLSNSNNVSIVLKC